jgi:hypothetical protein
VPSLGQRPMGFMISPPIIWLDQMSASTPKLALSPLRPIRRWRQKPGRVPLSQGPSPGVTADCGGSNGPQVRLWKRELQRFANDTGLEITVTHLLPGNSNGTDRAPTEAASPLDTRDGWAMPGGVVPPSSRSRSGERLASRRGPIA